MPVRTARYCRLFAGLFASAAFLAAQHDPIIENDQVRVLKVTDQPHVKGALHEHKFNRVMIYLQPGRQEITHDGKKTMVEWKAGEVRWSPANGMHTSEIVSDAPVTMIEVEVKKPGDAAKKIATPLDPPKADPQDYKVAFENDQVRVLRVHLPAHRNVPEHEHVLNRVTVYLTDQSGDQTTPDGVTTASHHNAGDVAWGTPLKHKERNLSDKPLDAVVIELKN